MATKQLTVGQHGRMAKALTRYLKQHQLHIRVHPETLAAQGLVRMNVSLVDAGGNVLVQTTVTEWIGDVVGPVMSCLPTRAGAHLSSAPPFGEDEMANISPSRDQLAAFTRYQKAVILGCSTEEKRRAWERVANGWTVAEIEDWLESPEAQL